MRKNAVISALIVLAALALASGAAAFRDADYEAAAVALKGEGGASGEAIFRADGFMPLEYFLGITVYGLEPNTVYSVWLTESPVSKDKVPLGIETNSFKTDGSGKGRYVTSVSHLKLRDWRALAIYRGSAGSLAPRAALTGGIRFY